MKNCFRKTFCFLLCTLLAFVCLPISASADMGPKPSVHITFKGMGEEQCYATLLSKESSTGPYSAFDERYEEHYVREMEACGIAEEIWRAFVDYRDSDGYYFLTGALWRVDEQKGFGWTYYPPDSFKILLYYPEREAFVVTDIYERYAFDTYYTVDLRGVDIEVETNDAQTNGAYERDPDDNTPRVYRSYQWWREVFSAIVRFLLTIAIEMGIGVLFGIRGKREYLLIAGVNVVTQIALNGMLNLLSGMWGIGVVLLVYLILEIGVVLVEAAIYAEVLRKVSQIEKPKRFYGIYSLVANAASFLLGLVISLALPLIF